jgi:hypothetical protein
LHTGKLALMAINEDTTDIVGVKSKYKIVALFANVRYRTPEDVI